MTGDALRAYYAREGGDRELRRLTRPDGRVEFTVNSHTILRYLQPNSRVLDLGGGPGQYTLRLAEHGHRVVLADASPELLAVAQDRIASSLARERVEDICLTDARDLSRWEDSSFDAVVSFGPYYHLPDRDDRDRATSEVLRVLQPGGLAFIALIARYGLIRRTISLPDEQHHLLDSSFMRALIEDGRFENEIPERFTHAYGALPQEIAPYFEGHGLATEVLLAS